jgi:hypothetical protein
MLLVGGSAALAAIAVYLAWHYINRWRVSLRRRRAEARIAIAERGQREEPADETRAEFFPAPGE